MKFEKNQHYKVLSRVDGNWYVFKILEKNAEKLKVLVYPNGQWTSEHVEYWTENTVIKKNKCKEINENDRKQLLFEAL